VSFLVQAITHGNTTLPLLDEIANTRKLFNPTSTHQSSFRHCLATSNKAILTIKLDMSVGRVERYIEQEKRHVLINFALLEDVQRGKFIVNEYRWANRRTVSKVFRDKFSKHVSKDSYSRGWIYSDALIDRALVKENATKTIQYYCNKNLNGMYCSSEGVGGTYATLVRPSFLNICHAIGEVSRSECDIQVSSDTTFMDIGAGQGHLLWYMAAVLGCRSIGVEVCDERAWLASQTALQMLVNEAKRPFPIYNRNVAYHVMSAAEPMDWSGVDIFFLWDQAFVEELTVAIHDNIGTLHQLIMDCVRFKLLTDLFLTILSYS
jgi:Histone methylation protein DOT1